MVMKERTEMNGKKAGFLGAQIGFQDTEKQLTQ